MSAGQRQANEQLFQLLAQELLADPNVSSSTMMGYPCLRASGAFFACVSKTTARLIVKLPAATVTELIATGEAAPSAPNGRTFREWAEIAVTDAEHWRSLLARARTFGT